MAKTFSREISRIASDLAVSTRPWESATTSSTRVPRIPPPSFACSTARVAASRNEDPPEANGPDRGARTPIRRFGREAGFPANTGKARHRMSPVRTIGSSRNSRGKPIGPPVPADTITAAIPFWEKDTIKREPPVSAGSRRGGTACFPEKVAPPSPYDVLRFRSGAIVCQQDGDFCVGGTLRLYFSFYVRIPF